MCNSISIFFTLEAKSLWYINIIKTILLVLRNSSFVLFSEPDGLLFRGWRFQVGRQKGFFELGLPIGRIIHSLISSSVSLSIKHILLILQELFSCSQLIRDFKNVRLELSEEFLRLFLIISFLLLPDAFITDFLLLSVEAGLEILRSHEIDLHIRARVVSSTIDVQDFYPFCANTTNFLSRLNVQLPERVH